MSDSETVRALADRQAITDLIYRYCRAVDRIDVELGYSIWHEGATADYGAELYQGDGRGLIDYICGHHRRALAHAHQVSNIIIDLDGDRAGSEAYVVADLRAGQGDRVRHSTTWGRYIDSWSRRDGRWGLDKRVVVRDLAETREVAPMPLPERSQRDRRDPSYDVLRDPA